MLNYALTDTNLIVQFISPSAFVYRAENSSLSGMPWAITAFSEAVFPVHLSCSARQQPYLGIVELPAVHLSLITFPSSAVFG
jgi:hypothetical protein